MSYGYQIWWEEPLTSECSAGFKGHARVRQGQPEVIFSDVLYQPKFCQKNLWLEGSALLGWKVIQRSYRDQPESSKGQFSFWLPYLVKVHVKVNVLSLCMRIHPPMGLKLALKTRHRGSKAYFKSDPINVSRSYRGQSVWGMPHGYQVW